MAIEYFGQDEGVANEASAAGPLIPKRLLPEIAGHFWRSPEENGAERGFYHLHVSATGDMVRFGWLTSHKDGAGYWTGIVDAEGEAQDVFCNTLEEIQQVLTTNLVQRRLSGHG